MHAYGSAMSTVMRFIRCRSQGRELIAARDRQAEGVLLVKMPSSLNKEIALARIPKRRGLPPISVISGMGALAAQAAGCE